MIVVPCAATKLPSTLEFDVKDEEVDNMIDELSKAQRWNKDDIEYLSKAWIRAVMSQPYKKKKHMRRPFEYSKKKLAEYLDWRTRSCITSKISHHLNSDGEEFAKLTKSPGSLYWYGTDNEGSPILWYHSDLMKFDEAMEVKDEMEVTSLVIQAAIDAMPANIHNFNFVICFDIFNPMKALRHPNLAPAFIKTFMRICPDRLKRGVFLTGTLGHVFYKLAKRLASSSIMDKVIETRSREETANFFVSEGLVGEHQVPTFMGGTYAHDDKITKCFPTMIDEIKKTMMRG